MLKKIALGMALLTGLSGADESSKSAQLDISQPLLSGWLAVQGDLLMGAVWGDSIIIDPTDPDYIYPGRAMILSLLIPGAGQVYVKRPLRGAAFLAMDVLAFFVWRDYYQQGVDLESQFQLFANTNWSFLRWYNEALNYSGGAWEQVGVGRKGTHELEYFVEDMDGDGRPEYFGNTGDANDRLAELIASADTVGHIKVRPTHEYFENIGKYNQFFSGWADADPNNPDIENTRAGPVAWSIFRRDYVNQRGESNRLKGLAGYAISAALFNHVLSAADALFSASAWNRKHAFKISGRLLRDGRMAAGFSAVEVSVGW